MLQQCSYHTIIDTINLLKTSQVVKDESNIKLLYYVLPKKSTLACEWYRKNKSNALRRFLALWKFVWNFEMAVSKVKI